ncbi:maltase 1-like [Anoplolepis gracilipes]|uniref:maltase 1-like n=1 Tax=Anoplolepis gracilipes TaxID=354296 RepID=UPI003BA15E46
MSLTTRLCVFLLLVSSSFATILNKTWWNNTVFYQVYPRSLYDTNADGIGDLKGITAKLSYFMESGINAIWLSPIYPSPQVDFGYDISNFTDVDPIYGSLEDFKELLAKAKRLGLKLVLDLVPNHTSDKHPWFQKALKGDPKYKHYYMWADGKNKDDKTPPNNWISVFSDSAWTYIDSLKQWYLHQFDYRQPDLNFSNPDVREEMENVLKFWLDLGIDGFRVDSTAFIFEDKELRDEPRSYDPNATPRDYTYLNHIYTLDQLPTYELLGTWRKYVDQYADERNQDQKLMVMEAYTSLPHTILYYHYNLTPFNFEFIRNITVNSSAQFVKDEMDLWMNSMPTGEVANWVMGNHDNPRVASRFPGRSDQMTMLSMIMPGLAVTYNGDEIGMVDKRDISWNNTQDPQACNAGKEHYKAISRDPERTPFQWDGTKNAGFSKANSTWLPVNENYKTLNLYNQIRAHESHYKIYKTLAHMHRKDPALTEGSYRSFTTNNGTVLGVIRNSGCRTVLLLINFKDDISQRIDLSGKGLPKKMMIKVSSLGSCLRKGLQVSIKNIHLPKKAAVVYTSLNFHCIC